MARPPKHQFLAAKCPKWKRKGAVTPVFNPPWLSSGILFDMFYNIFPVYKKIIFSSHCVKFCSLGVVVYLKTDFCLPCFLYTLKIGLFLSRGNLEKRKNGINFVTPKGKKGSLAVRTLTYISAPISRQTEGRRPGDKRYTAFLDGAAKNYYSICVNYLRSSIYTMNLKRA